MVQGFPASVPLNKNVRPETCWAAPRPGSLGQSLCTEGGGGKDFTGLPVPATKCLLKSFVCTLSLQVSSNKYLTLLLLPLSTGSSWGSCATTPRANSQPRPLACWLLPREPLGRDGATRGSPFVSLTSPSFLPLRVHNLLMCPEFPHLKHLTACMELGGALRWAPCPFPALSFLLFPELAAKLASIPMLRSA